MSMLNSTTVFLLALLSLPSSTSQTQQSFSLKRFEVIRIDANAMRLIPQSLRPLLVQPSPDGEPVQNLEEATKRAGFTPRVLQSPPVSGFVAVDAVNADVKINATQLTAALLDAKIGDVSVPPDWDGIVIGIHQDRGILTNYGDFLISQSPPLTIKSPEGFPLDRLLEMLLRIVGIGVQEAGALRTKFSANPAAFFPIPARYEMDNRQVQLKSGSGLLLQNAQKGGELALMWSDNGRSYLLTGLLTEADAIATANALQ